MKNVLIVDDEQNFLLSLADMLKDPDNKFEVLTANNGKEAAEIIDSKAVDLVVTDLKMPEMDGFELIAHINNQKPETPVIAMTAYGTTEMESRLMKMGTFQYIEKPIDFTSLLKKINEGLSSGKKGHVSGISLPSFLQLLELDKKTCTLTLSAGGQEGRMYFQQGELIDAHTGDIKGQDAAFELIQWDNTEIEIENVCRHRERTIEAPLGFILIESARMKDEKSMPPEAKKKEAPRAAVEKKSPDISKATEVNVSDIDFATKPPAIKEKEIDPAPLAPQKKSTGEELAELINNEAGVTSHIVIAGDGSVLSQANVIEKDFSAFVALLTGAVLKAKKLLGATGLHHILVGRASGEKLLIITGAKVVAGICISSEANPSTIGAKIRPAILKAQT